MKENNYDVVVIGAGSGGLTSAVGLSKVGKKVLLIEREHMGGECTNSGCIPSKALLHHAKQYRQAIEVAGSSHDSENYRREAFSYVREKINAILADETPEHFKNIGIEVVMGEAVFTGPQKLTVAGVEYSFKKAIIATGSSPRIVPIPGLDTIPYLTNQNFFELDSAPARTLIIGGGPIGMEMGQALSMLGSKVTIIDNGDRFAKLEDISISPIIEKVFKDYGVEIFLNAGVKQIFSNIAEVEVKSESSETPRLHQISFDKVLVAVGRVPNLPQGLSEANIDSSPYGITVDKNWRSSNKNVYALGDVAARLKFTHVADDTGRQVITHIVSRGLISVKEKAVPKVTFTEPEIAQVGMSHKEALETFGKDKIHRIEVSFAKNDRAHTDNDTDGLLIIIAKRLTGKILGAHIIGPRAGELIGTVTLAMENNISLYKVRSTIFAYPTYSLILKKAGDQFLAKQFSTLKTDVLAALKKNAPKIVVAVLWIWGLLALFSYQQTFGLTPSELALKLFGTITSTPWAPLLYILAYTIRPITFIPGTALTILSGVFFGLWGILYTIIGAALSSAVAYFVGHFFSKAINGDGKLLANWTDYLHKNPFMAVLMMRLTFFPFDLVAYGAGILKVKFMPFLLATILGTLLGIATFVTIGASISVEEFARNGISTDAIDIKFIIISVIIFIASHVAAKLFKRKYK
jgi:pyruvate/2-oxoglutarate dehydrogenase complex dihydrolipoamide dehydrogenase (E3) component/uncharacterized membrane protein YdjX (TVP38/TMEM64 family)